MKAPIDWFLYMNYPPQDGDWRRSIDEMKSRLNVQQYNEIEAFLRSALMSKEEDLYVIRSEELNTELYLQLDEGTSIRDVWVGYLDDFVGRGSDGKSDV